MPLPRIVEQGRPTRGRGSLGAANVLVFGDSLADGIAAQAQAQRPAGDTWNEVSIGSLGLDTIDGSGSGSGAIGTGSNSFKVRGHDVYYSPGARNVAVLLSITHRDVQDIRDATTAIMSRLKTLGDSVRALGWSLCVCTIPPTTEYNNPAGSPYTRPERIAINSALRAGGLGQPPRVGAEYLANIDGIPGFDQGDVPTSGGGSPYLDGGGIHLTTAGKIVVASCICAAIF